MAKKSVRSQGYVKQQKKKSSGYTPQEKKIMIIGFTVIALVIIGVLVVPDLLESIHLLKVKDGVVQGVEDNELICNMGTSSANKKYRKLASVEPVEGYQLARVEDGISDVNLRYFVFEPENPQDAPAGSVTIQSGNGSASELTTQYRERVSGFSEVLRMDDEVREETINGVKAYAFTLEYRMVDYSEEAASAEATPKPEDENQTGDEEEEEKEYNYTQSAVVYLQSAFANKCVVIQAANDGKDESAFGDADALMDLALKAAANVTILK